MSSPSERAGGAALDPVDRHEEALAELGERIEDLIRSRDLTSLQAEMEDLHPSDIADLIEALDTDEERVWVLSALPASVASETLVEMEESEERTELLASMDPTLSAELLQEMADDDAADLIAALEPEEQARVLAAFPEAAAGDLRELLSYAEDTAGGIMTTWLVAVLQNLTAGEALSEVRRQGREIEDEFYTVFVVDGEGRLVGILPLYDLVLAEPHMTLAELAEPATVAVSPDTDQEEVGRLFGRYNLAAMPVVDADGVLLGRITFDDIIDVIEEEQTEDILRLAGTSDDEELRGGWLDAVRSRLPWLALNLFTAMIAASVVYYFQATIEAVVVLAAIMPIIAGMGGNAATQALAVTVRRIALSDGPLDDNRGAVAKEMVVGLANGAVLATMAALLATYLPGGNRELGLVVLMAMWGNIVVAGFAGAFIPTVLDRFGIDPAVASSVFVTTLTDLCGFFLLLGLASSFLL